MCSGIDWPIGDLSRQADRQMNRCTCMRNAFCCISTCMRPYMDAACASTTLHTHHSQRKHRSPAEARRTASARWDRAKRDTAKWDTAKWDMATWDTAKWDCRVLQQSRLCHPARASAFQVCTTSIPTQQGCSGGQTRQGARALRSSLLIARVALGKLNSGWQRGRAVRQHQVHVRGVPPPALRIHYQRNRLSRKSRQVKSMRAP